MFMKKFIAFFIFVIIAVLAGCTKTEQVDTEPIIPDAIDIVNLGDTNEVNIGKTQVELMFVTIPSNASQSVTWSSSDISIAIVSEDGVVTGVSDGVAMIRATSDHDATVYAEFEVEVYNDDASLEVIDEIKASLDKQIPAVAEESFEIPYFHEDIRLYWQSSDTGTIGITGRVEKNREDTTVTLTATFTVGRVGGVFEKDVLVEGYTLRPMAEKPVFTYLFDGAGFSGFRDGDLERIDVINLSFGGISNGRLSVGSIPNRARIVREAHEAGTRVVLAIGGWGVDGFSQAVRTKDTRKVFIDSIIEGIHTYKLDGIDLDWEYPGNTAGGLIESHPDDVKNFTIFIGELRKAMKAVDEDLILSIAVPTGAWGADNYYEPAKINPHLDYVHVMSYDLINYSTFDTTHHTNLFYSDYSYASAEAGVKAYINRGIDKEKIILGVAFYGHTFITVDDGEIGNGMNAKTATYLDDDGKIVYDRGSISYADIAK